MALQLYAYNGSTYKFDPRDVPAGAVLIEHKARRPQAAKAPKAENGPTTAVQAPKATDTAPAAESAPAAPKRAARGRKRKDDPVAPAGDGDDW